MSKITAGFKCDPNLKADLEYYAREYGQTMSSFIENICSDYVHALENDEVDPSDAPYDTNGAEPNPYEAMLAPFFDIFRGQTLDMRMPDGRVVQKQVSSPIDVLEIVLASVKTRP